MPLWETALPVCTALPATHVGKACLSDISKQLAVPDWYQALSLCGGTKYLLEGEIQWQ